MRFLERVSRFITSVEWKWAKTYDNTAPHWYIVSSNYEHLKDEFDYMVSYINRNGVTRPFFRTTYTYLFLGNYKYWVMSGSDGATIINRALAIKSGVSKKKGWY